MLATVIPVMSLVSYAAEPVDTTGMTQEEAYDFYKDLYYDDGHLMSFVNMSGLQKSDLAYLTDSDFAENGSDARIVFGYTKGEDGLPVDTGKTNPASFSDGANNVTYHNFVKIMGGKYAGRYYMLANRCSADARPGVITLLENGFLDFDEMVGKPEGVYIGAALSFEQIQNKFKGLNDTENIGGEIVGTEFLLPGEAAIHNGTYGAFTLETVDRIMYNDEGGHFGASDAVKSNPYMRYLYGYADSAEWNSAPTGSLTLSYDGDSLYVSQFGTGPNHAWGLCGQVNKWPENSTLHFTHGVIFTNESQLVNSSRPICRYAIGNTSGVPYSEIILPNQRALRTFNARSEESTRAGICVSQTGRRCYYFRLYDTELTNEQIAQNHFADLCYFYRLSGTEILAQYGKLALTKDFYYKFLQYDLGQVASTTSLQKIIDDAIAEAGKLTVDDVKTAANTTFTKIMADKTTADNALASVADVITQIDGYIEDAKKTTPANDKATVILAQITANLEAYKSMALAIQSDVNAYKSDADKMYNAANAAKTALTASSDITTVIAQNYIIEANSSLIAERARDAAYNSLRVSDVAFLVLEQKYMADAANANASVPLSSYIKFAGFQQNLTGSFGMRAVYSINKELLGTTYNYMGEEYDILEYGFINAEAEASIEDITVDFTVIRDADDKVIGIDTVTSNNTNAYIVRAKGDDRMVDDDMDFKLEVSIKTGLAGEVFTNERNFIGYGYNDYKTVFNKEYSFRAYMIFSNGDATYVKYVDAIGSTLGESVSLYELATAINNSSDEVSKQPHLLVAQTLHYAKPAPEVE